MSGILLSLLLALQAAAPPSPAAQHLHAGVEAEKSGQLDVALTEFQKATELDPKLAIAFVDVGDIYMEKHDYAAAIAPLKRAVELSPNLEGAHRLLGYALLAQGYATEAIPHLEKAHAEDALGIALVEAGKLQQAMPVLQKALSQNPNDPDLLYYYGRAAGLLSKQVFDELEDRFPGFRACPSDDGAGLRSIARCPECRTGISGSAALAPTDGGPASGVWRALRARAAMGQGCGAISTRNRSSAG